MHHEGLGPDGAVSWFFAYKAATYAINNPTPLGWTTPILLRLSLGATSDAVYRPS